MTKPPNFLSYSALILCSTSEEHCTSALFQVMMGLYRVPVTPAIELSVLSTPSPHPPYLQQSHTLHNKQLLLTLTLSLPYFTSLSSPTRKAQNGCRLNPRSRHHASCAPTIRWRHYHHHHQHSRTIKSSTSLTQAPSLSQRHRHPSTSTTPIPTSRLRLPTDTNTISIPHPTHHHHLSPPADSIFAGVFLF